MQKFKKGVIETGIQTLMSSFFQGIVAAMSHDKKNKELHYVKMPLELENGGLYLVSILHVDGPKFNFDTYRQVVEATEKKLAEEAAAAKTNTNMAVMDSNEVTEV